VVNAQGQQMIALPQRFEREHAREPLLDRYDQLLSSVAATRAGRRAA
jgi:hypothetical protein